MVLGYPATCFVPGDSMKKLIPCPQLEFLTPRLPKAFSRYLETGQSQD
jgi:hypothetical protein